LLSDINTPVKIVAPAKPFTVKEVRTAINVLNPKKTPAYDLIINQFSAEAVKKEIQFIIQLCNAIRR